LLIICELITCDLLIFVDNVICDLFTLTIEGKAMKTKIKDDKPTLGIMPESAIQAFYAKLHEHEVEVEQISEQSEQPTELSEQLDDSWLLTNSACFAAPSPDSAVLENAVVETAQGTTIRYLPVTYTFSRPPSLLRFETERLGG
jgi:hypothetical protein